MKEQFFFALVPLIFGMFLFWFETGKMLWIGTDKNYQLRMKLKTVFFVIVYPLLFLVVFLAFHLSFKVILFLMPLVIVLYLYELKKTKFCSKCGMRISDYRNIKVECPECGGELVS